MARAMERIKVIKWGLNPIRTSSPLERPAIEYCPYLLEGLDWGPQHVDLETQYQMRRCYFRHTLAGVADFAAYTEALEAEDDVIFWCEPVLRSALAILWALDTLVTRGTDLRRAYLVLAPGRSELEIFDPEAVHLAIARRIPVLEVIRPLVAARRHLASDSHTVCPDLSPLPPPVRDWAAVTNRLEDFLPDERGLDIVDSLLLDRLAEGAERGDGWSFAAWVVVLPDAYAQGHSLAGDRLWEHLMEMGEITPDRAYAGPANPLVSARYRGRPRLQSTRFRITRLGVQVRAGEVDAMRCRPFFRWVGGRLVTSERPLRRSEGAHTTAPMGA